MGQSREGALVFQGGGRGGRYLPVTKSEMRRCGWVGHRHVQLQWPCSGTSLITAVQLPPDLFADQLPSSHILGLQPPPPPDGGRPDIRGGFQGGAGVMVW